VDRLQQLLKDCTDPCAVLWAMRGMESQDGDAGGQLLKGQQGITVEFLRDGRGGIDSRCIAMGRGISINR
jgi:hypothetical protein